MEMIGELRIPSRFTSRDRASHALVYSEHGWYMVMLLGQQEKRNICLCLEANPDMDTNQPVVRLLYD
jgi:hypothetical protein